MDSNLLATIISAICILAGTIITVVATNSKTRAELELKQEWNKKQIEELRSEVKEHNSYAKRIPVIENEIDHIKNAIEELKHD